MKYENFNDGEALKIAMNIEEEGLEFYSALVENTKDPKIKEIFSELASAEKKHFATFQKAYLEVTSTASTPQSCEDYTVGLYLKYLVDTGIFTRKGEAKRIAGEIKTDRDALKVGIQAEKDSILYYTEAAKITRNNAGKKAFEQLVNEEKMHLKILAECMNNLKQAME
ncbi:MAG: ferritin family protein [Candidatus Brocadiaceae bacterium]